MRKITQQAIEKFMNAEPFKSSNTEVVIYDTTFDRCEYTTRAELRLFGNTIAKRYNDPENTTFITNCGWKTMTTKERLNGIPNVNITQRNKVWYLNGKEWDGKLININPKYQ